MNKLVSIIVPVYNGEKHLERCIDSILRQHDVDTSIMELILINDGSTRQGSKEIIDKYAKANKDTIVALHQKNAGAAATRNTGIAMARGKYTILADQDDSIEPDFVATLLEAIDKYQADVVQSGFRSVGEDGRVVSITMPIKTNFGKYLAIPAWAKIYRTQFLTENKIKFFENNIGEDIIFTVDVIKHAQYKTINYAGYNNYFDNSESVTNTLHKGLHEGIDLTSLLDRMYELIQDDGREKSLLTYCLIRTSYYYLLSYGKYATPERFNQVYGEISTWLNAHDVRPEKNRYIWFAPFGEKASARFSMPLFTLVHKLKAVPLFAKIYAKG